MIIKILGSGCKNCTILAENAQQAVKTMGIDATVEKVTDYPTIMSFGVMATPAMVVDEKLVSSGKVLKAEDIIKLLSK